MEKRWANRLKGLKESKGIGEYELEVELAMHFHWSPEEIGRMSDDYLDELLARMRAEGKKGKGRNKKKGRSWA